MSREERRIRLSDWHGSQSTVHGTRWPGYFSAAVNPAARSRSLAPAAVTRIAFRLSAEYAGTGRIPKYCSDSHRKRASQLRTAPARAALPVDEGGRTTEPVREVIERTETVTRTVVRQGPVEIRRVPAARGRDRMG
ncbi:hypothetical protein [Streptomyces scopuliridis]|uniref:hypothetical protein n=1 Tax=Streptomyces scopuliridis TaxID=452529 RepID=UPI0036B445F4